MPDPLTVLPFGDPRNPYPSGYRPLPTSAGQIQQAKARNNARRGATPNAPEVPNEEAPAGSTGVPGVASPYLATQENALGFGVQPGTDLNQAPRPGLFGEGGTLQRMAQESARSNLAATPTTGAISGATVAAAQPTQPTPPTNPNVGTAAAEDRGFTPQDGEDEGQAVASNLPAGIVRQGNSYTGTGTGTTAPYQPDPNQRDFRQQQEQQTDAADLQSRNQAMAAHAAQAGAWTDRNRAESEARVARFRATNGADMILAPENSGYDEQRQAIMVDAAQKGAAAETARGAYNQAGVNASFAGARNPVVEGTIQSEAANRNLLAQEAAANQENMRPLQTQESRQRIAGMEQANQMGGLQLAGAQRESGLMDQISKAKTTEERTALLDALIGMRGQSKLTLIDMDTGQVDPMTGAPIYKKVAVNQSGRIITPEGQTMQGKQKLPEGWTAERLRAKADADVKSGKATREQANAALKAYGL